MVPTTLGEVVSLPECRFLATLRQPRNLRNFRVPTTLGEVISVSECRLLASSTGARHGTNYSSR